MPGAEPSSTLRKIIQRIELIGQLLDRRTIAYLHGSRRIRKTHRLDRARLEAHQKRLLVELVRSTMRSSPAYRELWEAHSIREDNFEQMIQGELLAGFPTVDKRWVMDNFDGVLCRPDPLLRLGELQRYIARLMSVETLLRAEEQEGGPLIPQLEQLKSTLYGAHYGEHRKYTVASTSGSTGEPGIVVFDDLDEFPVLGATIVDRASQTRLELAKILRFLLFIDDDIERQRLLYCGIRGLPGGYVIASSCPRAFFEFEEFSIRMTEQDIIARATRMDPHQLGGYASAIEILADAQLDGRLDISPRKVVASSQAVTRMMREQFQKAWPDCEVINLYAATEHLGIAVECRSHDDHDLHLMEDTACIRVIRGDGTEAGPGQSGKVAITPLYKTTQPLINYLVGDEVELSDHPPCRASCRSSFRRIKAVVGRSDDEMVFVRDGEEVRIDPLIFPSLYFGFIKKFQAIQTEPDRIRFDVVTRAEPLTEDQRQSIVDKLEADVLRDRGLVGHVDLRVEEVDQIPLVRGKVKSVVSLAARRREGRGEA